MANERIEMYLACRETCPFSRNCGQSYVDEENPCVSNINSVVVELKKSLLENPALDTDEKNMKFSNPSLGTIVWQGEVPIFVELEMKLKNGVVRNLGIRLGEISRGEVVVYGYNNEVRDRIKGTASIVD